MIPDALAALRARTLGRCGDPGSYEQRWTEGLLPLVERRAADPTAPDYDPVLAAALAEDR